MRVREKNRPPDVEEDLWLHPMTARAHHGQAGDGEPLALVLRPGNAADHIEAARLALA
jgi:hypothetical protein